VIVTVLVTAYSVPPTPPLTDPTVNGGSSSVVPGITLRGVSPSTGDQSHCDHVMLPSAPTSSHHGTRIVSVSLGSLVRF
jgi:hypothetical protein